MRVFAWRTLRHQRGRARQRKAGVLSPLLKQLQQDWSRDLGTTWISHRVVSNWSLTRDRRPTHANTNSHRKPPVLSQGEQQLLFRSAFTCGVRAFFSPPSLREPWMMIQPQGYRKNKTPPTSPRKPVELWSTRYCFFMCMTYNKSFRRDLKPCKPLMKRRDWWSFFLI